MNAANFGRLHIVVLAAGFSSRLGRPKALAHVRGLSLLRRTLKIASSLGANRIIVVVPRNAARYRVEARGLKVRWSVNTRPAQGLSSSVRRGIAAATCAPAALLLPADLVDLKGRDLFRLARRWQGAQRRLVARRVDSSGAAPAILPRWLFPRAAKLTGDVGLRDLIRRMPADRCTLVEMPSAAADVDTVQDLKDARMRFQRRSI